MSLPTPCEAGETSSSARGIVLRGGSPQTVADPAAEIRRLQRENEYLRRQREILKKAASILAEDPQLGMR